MTDIQKFFSDVGKIIKHDRADNAGNYNAERASRAVADFFVSSNKGMAELPSSLAEYWLNNKVLPHLSEDPCPSADAIDWLGDAQELLDGTIGTDTHFSADDWAELRDMVNCEAEDLPIDALTSMMSVIMDHGAI